MKLLLLFLLISSGAMAQVTTENLKYDDSCRLAIGHFTARETFKSSFPAAEWKYQYTWGWQVDKNEWTLFIFSRLAEDRNKKRILALQYDPKRNTLSGKKIDLPRILKDWNTY